MMRSGRSSVADSAQRASPGAIGEGAGARRIALDAMGGDFAPGEVVLGAVQAARELGASVLLVGPHSTIQQELAGHDTQGLDLEIVQADEVIGMDEHPVEAVRTKKRNSITVAHELVRNGRAAGAVSAGNSGAVLAAAIFTLRRNHRVDRPAFGGVVPAAGGARTRGLDVGAKPDCKPPSLQEFARTSAPYMQSVYAVSH